MAETVLTVYPDADPESSSVDGYAGHEAGSSTWAFLVGAAGTVSDSSFDFLYCCYIQPSATTDTWAFIERGILLFDTSSIPSGATIISATLSLYGVDKNDHLSITPSVNIYASNPNIDTGLKIQVHLHSSSARIDQRYPFYNSLFRRGAGIYCSLCCC